MSLRTRQEPGSALVATSVSIKELAGYLGHSDPAFTLRVYAHMLLCSHDRARAVISERFTQVIRKAVIAGQSYRTSRPVMARPMIIR